MSRKSNHIKISLERDVSYRKTTWLEYVELVHQAAPELDLEDITTETTFLGRKFSYPFIIESMTGGTAEAEKINGNLGEAAAVFKIPMGVGSQRAGVVKPETIMTYRVARDRGPDAFLIGNIGASQLVEKGVEIAFKAVKMIDADALAIHLNPLQELIQPDGRARFRGFFKIVSQLKNELSIPLILKEVGCGLSREVVAKGEESGIDVFDVAGSGGTNWTLIEMIRAEESKAFDKKALAEVFLEWGLPTAAAVLEAVSITSKPVIASGGLLTGLDAAKALSLGASMAGFARPLLRPAAESVDQVLRKLNQLSAELMTAMYLVGCRDVEALKKAPKVLLGPLHEWYVERIIHGSK